ncbi:MAG: hypothetical protein ABW116_02645 [Candidatus Sedimenticola sp. 20ELBAFRAG]
MQKEIVLDRLNRLAKRAAPFQGTALIFSLTSLLAITASLLLLEPGESDYYLYPLIIIFLWFLSIYALVDCFKEIPSHPREQKGLLNKLKSTAARCWSWLVGVVFIMTTLGVMMLSWKLINLWIKNY